MSTRKLSIFASALVAAVGLGSSIAMSASPSLSFSQLQSLSSEGPTWHANDGSVYDPNGAMTRSRSVQLSEANPVNGYVGSSSGTTITGSQAPSNYQGSTSTE
jgi:hypothetical protein